MFTGPSRWNLSSGSKTQIAVESASKTHNNFYSSFQNFARFSNIRSQRVLFQDILLHEM